MTSYSPHIEEVRAVRSTRERIADILSRYPHLSPQDRDEVLRFMKEARHLEVGLLTSNEQVRPKLDAFMEEHRSHFAPSWGEIAAVVAALVGLLAVLWLIWAAFA